MLIGRDLVSGLVVVPRNQIKMLILQPTAFCNIDCSYCILPNRTQTGILSEDTLTAVIQNLSADNLFSDKITVLWHSGEPLIVGLDYYRRMFDLFQTLLNNVRIDHSILTNGILIDDAWCNFFLENDINVGVSCDGPAFLHNANRKTRSGQGTHERVMHGIELLNQHNIKFYILSVLTSLSLRHADDIVNFCIENSIKELCFNIEETEGVNISSTLKSDDVEDLVRSFFDRILYHCFYTKHAPWVREIHQMFLRFYRDSDCELQNRLTEPFKIVSVDREGNWCTFSPELMAKGLSFGNLIRSPMSQHISTSNFLSVQQSIQEGVERCRRSCDYFSVCGGGAPSNKLAECGALNISETKYCRTMVKVIADICMAGIDKYVLSSAYR